MTFIFMIYKLVTFKLSFISAVRLLFLDGLNINLNKKVKKVRTFLYFVYNIGLGDEACVMGPGENKHFSCV